MKKSEEVLTKYKGKLLGACSYKENYKYTGEVLSNPDETYGILVEVFSHESDLTKEGIYFLEEYYGFEDLAKFLADEGGLGADARTKEEIYVWLQNLKKFLSE